MQRNVFRLAALMIGLSSSVSVAQTLKPRPLVGSQQQSNRLNLFPAVREWVFLRRRNLCWKHLWRKATQSLPIKHPQP
jgi:hypothetical protein